MFKPSTTHHQPRAKSPYQPKLLQTLMDSSSDDNDSMSNDSMSDQQIHQNEEDSECYQETKGRFKHFVANDNNGSSNDDIDKRSQVSAYSQITGVTEHSGKTILGKVSTSSMLSNGNNRNTYGEQQQSQKILSNNNNNNKTMKIQNQTHQPHQQPLNLTRFTHPKQSKPSTNQPLPQSESSLSFNSLSQKQKTSHSPAMTIKYDTIKLSQYNTEQVIKEEQLYQQNLQQFKQRFPTSKQAIVNQEYKQDECQQQAVDGYVDSLEAMKQSTANNKRQQQLSRKSLVNSIQQSSTPSSRIRFLQQQKQQMYLQEEQESHRNLNQSTVSSSQIQKLKQQLKRSTQIIKTLSLKNSDLQNTLQMQSTKLKQFQSEENSRLTQFNQQKHQRSLQKNTYQRIGLYMKERVKEFMEEIRNIKMSPLLEEKLEDFLAQVVQLNQATIDKKLGIFQAQQQNYQQIQSNDPPKHSITNIAPNHLSKSIFNTRQPFNEREEHPTNSNNRGYSTITAPSSNNLKTRFQTTHTESHITIASSNRENAFISSKSDFPSRNSNTMKGGMTVKVDLSANKENLTPNKQNLTPNRRPNADQEFKMLEKSLHKLKAMEKQLHTPLPKNQFLTNKSHLQSKNDQDYRTEYSIINRSHFSALGKDQNSAMNLSSNNLDRSKSRRKKIFAQTNQKA